MPRIIADRNELRQAHDLHSRPLDHQSSASDLLLSFYSVECGLKCICLRKRQLTTTAEMEQAGANFGHDLRRLIIDLRLPAAVCSANPSFRLKKDNTDIPFWGIKDVHQAWRYGVEVEPDDEQKLIQWLSDVAYWVKENI